MLTLQYTVASGHCDSFEVLEGPDDGSEYDTAEDDVVMIEQELVGHKGQTLREQTDMEYILQQKQVGIEEFMELHGHTDEDSSDMDQVRMSEDGDGGGSIVNGMEGSEDVGASTVSRMEGSEDGSIVSEMEGSGDGNIVSEMEIV